jgi:hypothetical protein
LALKSFFRVEVSRPAGNHARSRGAFCVRGLANGSALGGGRWRPLEKRPGRDLREKARGRPGARCTRSPACSVKSIRVSHHRFTGTTPGLPCAVVLTVYAVLSLATNSSCHHRRRIGLIGTRLGRLRLRRLDTSNGCQDHTVCPSASSSRSSCAWRSLTGISSMDCPPCDLVPTRRRCRVHRIPPQRS